MTTNRKRTGKTTLPPSDHLADIPSPMHAGQGLTWMPADAIRAKTGLPADDVQVVAMIVKADEAWSAYRKALRAADLARFGDPALATPATRKARLHDLAHYYNRARLAAWTSSLGDAGLERWALLMGESILAGRLRKRVPGVTIDLLPDLPRRCDLTDASIEAAKAIQQGEHWARVRPGVEDAADAVIDEALADMGWKDDDFKD